MSAILLTGCFSKQSKQEESSDHPTWKHFTGKWFEFDYPSYMQVDVERNEISDTIPGLKEGGDVYVRGDYTPYHFRFTKSCMFDVFTTPEEWRDISIGSKFIDSSDESEIYLDVYDKQDSISFNGHPAASVTFRVLVNEDTVFHHQLVVLTQSDRSLYYLNYFAPKDKFSNYANIADSVFNSLILK